MELIRDHISVATLEAMAAGMFGSLVKAVVDVDDGTMVVDVEMHTDAEVMLLDSGARPRALWGINLHPAAFGTPEFIEFDSMVNIRPSQGNNSRDVEDAETRARIVEIVARLVQQ